MNGISYKSGSQADQFLRFSDDEEVKGDGTDLEAFCLTADSTGKFQPPSQMRVSSQRLMNRLTMASKSLAPVKQGILKKKSPRIFINR